MTEPTLFDAATQRDEAMARVDAAAPEEWKDAAKVWLEGYLRTHREFFPDTDLMGAPQPPERRAWGPIILWARRRGWITRTSEMRPRTHGHCTPAFVWRSVICEA